MMKASEIRASFLEFFKSKDHHIVPSAPMVVKGDPTLMFTNAGMNQFKDVFLGHKPIDYKRIANSQKCLRVSGKHNDLEEVGHDSYHHTMFEMLGNWSFGDYFKEEAIEWAWEYLTEVLKINKERLYASVFEGSEDDNLGKDTEAYDYWKKWLPEDHIVEGNKKDNFWEMGDVGPCGPCSEIHIDLRSDEERGKVDGKTLINADHPEVIEVWNLVFIQYNRKANGELEKLKDKFVDTGMGFERLCRIVQNKSSNYETDVFKPLIDKIEELSGVKYKLNDDVTAAMHVVADHIRTIAFSIADGQLPSNNKAGYVIRRILRRAVRYSYTFLNVKEPFIYRIVPVLVDVMGDAYPELRSQQELIEKVIKEEEEAFLRTLATGINLLDKIIRQTKIEEYKVVSGKVAFELYDTYGFPLDLTELILKEQGLVVNRREFEEQMDAQKKRARNATSVETEDWIILREDDEEEFLGYDYLETDVKITKYRKIKTKKKEQYQLVFDITPFYGESGGQIGDKGYIESEDERIHIVDTQKEHNLIVHIVDKLPENLDAVFKAVVDKRHRQNVANNHTSTHLLHYALRKVLGDHVEQKGSLVHSDYLRFDFSHYQKVTEEELTEVERIVNRHIRTNYALEEFRNIPYKKALDLGAVALFGEKYGDVVRAVKFGDSMELCGGTHVKATGEIGCFKIFNETSVAAGVRRIEAVTAEKAEELIESQFRVLRELQQMFKNPRDIKGNIQGVIEQNEIMNKEINSVRQTLMSIVMRDLEDDAEVIAGVKIMSQKVQPMLGPVLKDFAFKLKKKYSDVVAILGASVNGKPQLAIVISENLVKEKGLNASEIVREAAKYIKGGGGGQPFFATAGGKDINGLDNAINAAKTIVTDKLTV
ncbi:MAG: alanine--tRNA ligase [Chlorobi bacterium]|nr:alanine--tRNA ligase [Chlorobiota bacterium]